MSREDVRSVRKDSRVSVYSGVGERSGWLEEEVV